LLHTKSSRIFCDCVIGAKIGVYSIRVGFLMTLIIFFAVKSPIIFFSTFIDESVRTTSL